MSTSASYVGKRVFSHVEIDARPPAYIPRPHKLPRISARPAASTGAPLYKIVQRHVLFNGEVKYEVEVQSQTKSRFIASVDRVLDFVSPLELEVFEDDVSHTELINDRKAAAQKAVRRARRLRARRAAKSTAADAPPVSSESSVADHTSVSTDAEISRFGKADLTLSSADRITDRASPLGILASKRTAHKSTSTTSAGTDSPRDAPRSSTRQTPIRTSVEELLLQARTAPATKSVQARNRAQQSGISVQVPAVRQENAKLSRISLTSTPEQVPMPRGKKAHAKAVSDTSSSVAKGQRVTGRRDRPTSRQRAIKAVKIPKKARERAPILYHPIQEIPDSELSSSSSDILGSSGTKGRKSPSPSSSPSKGTRPLHQLGNRKSASEKIDVKLKPRPRKKINKPGQIEAILDDKLQTQEFGNKLVITRFFLVKRFGADAKIGSETWLDGDDLEAELGEDAEPLKSYKARLRSKAEQDELDRTVKKRSVSLL
ncbi:MAG: hypothetical protein M4579_006658 [Chaenotheca gracillima]|nr:MAG: hypothetical protein M4579_006658 [Chaenotheca gracillima]